MADYRRGLQIIDISNPANPILAASHDTPSFANSVSISGSYAYVADFYSGLQIINIFNPADPSAAGSYHTPGIAEGVFVSGPYAYVADTYSLITIRTSCNYLPGDINGSGVADCADVVYGINYLSGEGAPPGSCNICPLQFPFFAAGDVNGNCAFNGVDITYLVTYLKGLQSTLLNCPSCPPSTQ